MKMNISTFCIRATGMKTFILLFILLVSTATALFADPSVKSTDLGNSVTVIGRLGKPLGTVLSIEGVGAIAAPRQVKTEETATALRITKVDGVKLDQPIIVGLIFAPSSPVELPKPGKTSVYQGFESGSFIGTPTAARKDLGPAASEKEYHFSTYFRVSR